MTPRESVLRGNRPATDAGQRILRQDYRGNESYTVTRKDILAVEAEARLAVVEEIKERLGPIGAAYDAPWNHIARVLDEVGVAARSAQSDSAGLTEERADGIGKPRSSGPPYNDEGIPM